MVFRTGSNLALTKLIALYFGPAGITLLAHFQNLVALFTTLPNDGTHAGLIRFLAPEKTGSVTFRGYLFTGLLLNFLLFLVLAAFLLIWPETYFSPFLNEGSGPGFWLWVLLFLAGMLLLLVFLLGLTVWQAKQRLPRYLVAQVAAAAGSLVLVAIFAPRFSLPQTLLAYLAGLSLPVWWLLFVALKNKRYWLQKPDFKKLYFRQLSTFLLMALSVLVGSKLVDFWVRDHIMEQFGNGPTGFWQAAVKLSDNYTMVFLAVLGLAYYPQLSARLAAPETVKAFVKPIFWTLSGAVLLGLVLVYGLRDWLLVLLFQQDFLPARTLLPYQLAGDLFKLSSWLLAYLLMAQEKVKLYIGLNLASAALYGALVLWLTQDLQMAGVVEAHFWRYLVFWLFLVIWFRKYLF